MSASPTPPATSPFPWLAALAEEPEDQSRDVILTAHQADFSPALVDALYQEVVHFARIDLRTAARLAQAAAHVAAQLNHPPSHAVAHRAQGHVAFLTGEHALALQHHRSAVQIFEAAGEPIQAARARMNQIQPLTYLGLYDDAYAQARAARATFLAHNDTLRVARLDVNLANVYYRQDRLAEALALYESARPVIESSSDPQDLAVLLRNMAVCHTTLNNFDLAAETYRQAREFCEAHGFPLLVAEADYNVAYLHFLRGEYTRAIALYQTARQLCARLNNRYHMALCDLDLSELYLELNMAHEAAQLADAAWKGFDTIGMNYEKAKAIAFSAIAASQLDQSAKALALFTRARSIFVAESNHVWLGLIDFYRSLVLYEERRFTQAARLARAALRTFLVTNLQTKAALAKILLARIAMGKNQPLSALRYCHRALNRLRSAPSPAIEFHAVAVLSAAQEALGHSAAAYATLQRANLILEDLRSQILGEAFRIGFLKDKLSIYRRLTALALILEPPESRFNTVFSYIERAKSRSLADLISLGTQTLRNQGAQPHTEDLRIEDLRQRMTMAYRQAVRADFRAERDSVDHIRHFRELSSDYEQQLALATSLPSAQGPFASLLSAGTLPLAEVLKSLAPSTALIEYFESGDRLHAAVLHRGLMRVIPLCSLEQAAHSLRLLQFQLSKFELGSTHLQRFQHSIQAATRQHLADLHSALIAPLLLPSTANHLVFVPHGCLHALPFHALLATDAAHQSTALMDRYTISYAPSASVYAWCRFAQPAPAGRSLVLGIPDAAAPSIREEASAVADLLPDASLFLGSTATRQILWQSGPHSRFIHIATHGLFRRDNPMFSSIRLGDTDLHPVDFYGLRLSARLVTLSGCGTGLNAIVGGDEILGLVRGLLYAGAQAVLVSLWDVNDAVTALFMKTFYRQLMHAPSISDALRSTMQSIRAAHPNPAYWAPFVLIGDAETPAFSAQLLPEPPARR
jgi:CHAT domain-containing protein